MEHYGSITTPVSVPRLIVGAMLAAGVAVLIMAFTKYGLLAGLAVSVIPAALCILWVTLRNPAISMLGLFVVNYFIMTLTRYAYDLPFGMILDALIFYNFLIITLQALMRPIEWKRASSGLTVVAAIWMAYCILEIVNPESVSVAGWFSSVRSIAFYFFFIVVLTQLTMTEYKYLKYMLAVWSVLTLIAVGKACMQKFFGFNAAENYWLFVLGGRSTHIIHSGVRYFSFFSDAANFGGSMGLSMVVFSISALYYRNSWMKLYLLLVAAAACYGMLISGTRSALAVPFVGYSAFIMMSRNIKMIGAGVFLIIAAFIFLKFTTIGQGNSIIRRARSAFNTNDPSFQVRLANQAKLRELMADKPFGAGLGHGGGKAKTFAPNAALSQIPTDSWFVMVWVETGVVGILLHIGILLYILARGAYLVIFKLRNTQLRSTTTATRLPVPWSNRCGGTSPRRWRSSWWTTAPPATRRPCCANATRKSKRCAASGTWDSPEATTWGSQPRQAITCCCSTTTPRSKTTRCTTSAKPWRATPRSAPYARRSGFSLPRGISSSPDIRP